MENPYQRLPVPFLWGMRVLGAFSVALGLYQLFLILTGRAWNCPQPPLVDMVAALNGLASVFMGGWMFLAASRYRLAIVLIVLGGLLAVLGIALRAAPGYAIQSCLP